MKLYILAFLLAASMVTIESRHRFVGTNVMRPLVYHYHAQYTSQMFRKRVENLHYFLPAVPFQMNRSIQGILAYDLTNSGATANITEGGIGFNYVNLRMKSDRGKRIHFDIYIFA